MAPTATPKVELARRVASRLRTTALRTAAVRTIPGASIRYDPFECRLRAEGLSYLRNKRLPISLRRCASQRHAPEFPLRGYKFAFVGRINGMSGPVAESLVKGYGA